MRRMSILLLSGVLVFVVSGCSSSAASQEQEGTRTVTVAVSGINTVEGWEVAGVLYEGLRVAADSFVVGGFAGTVDSASFEMTHTVRQPAFDTFDDAPDVEDLPPFPYVDDQVLLVEPGDYTLSVHMANYLHPYGRWVPACGGPPITEMYSTDITFTVPETSDAVVSVEFDPSTQDDLCTS